MPLESGDTIADLNPLWPVQGDPVTAGDDHLRLIKSVLQNDAVSKQLLADLVYPVGALFFTTEETDPATLYVGTTWERYASGRAVVGVGSNGQSNWPTGQLRGSEWHVLTAEEGPVHAHTIDPPATQTTVNGNHNHTAGNGGSFMTYGTGSVFYQASGSPSHSYAATTSTQGNHSHWVDIPAFASSVSLGGAAHNNIQPSVAVNIWRRVS